MSDIISEDFCGKYQRIKHLQVQTTLLNKIEDLEKSIQHLSDENTFLKAFIGSSNTQITDWCSQHFENMKHYEALIETLASNNEDLKQKVEILQENNNSSINNNSSSLLGCYCQQRMTTLEKSNSLLEEDVAVIRQKLKDLEGNVCDTLVTNEQKSDAEAKSQIVIKPKEGLSELKVEEVQEFIPVGMQEAGAATNDLYQQQEISYYPEIYPVQCVDPNSPYFPVIQALGSWFVANQTEEVLKLHDVKFEIRAILALQQPQITSKKQSQAELTTEMTNEVMCVHIAFCAWMNVVHRTVGDHAAMFHIQNKYFGFMKRKLCKSGVLKCTSEEMEKTLTGGMKKSTSQDMIDNYNSISRQQLNAELCAMKPYSKEIIQVLSWSLQKQIYHKCSSQE